ncbi:MAG TPA: enoyl-CoA hydratase/isomerase family protein [Magnetospirillaceae bacterium]|jgi:enoyl-CoA hydratase/carnithine racemase
MVDGTASPPVIVERAGAVAIITLNRPASLNAMSDEMVGALEWIVDDLAADDTIRAAIVTGAGKAFSAGGDLRQFGQQRDDDPSKLLATLVYNQGVLTKVERLPFPVIAAVNGVTVAGGLELALCCDVILASDQAMMGDGHAKYAIVPAGGSSVRLLIKIAPNHAHHMLYSAELFPAATLKEWGLVNEVAAADQLLPRARQIADHYGLKSPQVLRHMKALAQAPFRTRIDAGLRAEIETFRIHLESRDLAEGLKAFREKRKPNY